MEPHKFAAQPHSSKRVRRSQSPELMACVAAVVCLTLLLALAIGATGCTSTYHRARAQLPPDPVAELGLRLAEADRAEAHAREAGARLLDSLQRNLPRAVVEADFDRLEAAAFDLERRVLAVHGAAARCGQPARHATEIESLDRKTDAWLGYVQKNRLADPSTQIRTLQGLLQ